MAKVIEGVHDYSREDGYVLPEEQEVLEHLEWFKDQKLGLMIHWAPGSQFSVPESWTLAAKTPWDTDSDAPWMTSDVNWIDNLEEYRESLMNTNKTFNPVKFRPEQWAKMAKDCGFKYLLFTTKHHDGFCMYDSEFTDYKITAADCPFHTHKHADIVASLYDAFRKEGLGISVYFSKPDWHVPYYWSPDFPNNYHINANYSPEEHPELWEQFVQYTHNQIKELTSRYGKVDALWLDGSWVSEGYNHQNVRIGEVVDEIRATTQPHLIVAERESGGRYENILTPEQKVPDEPILVPWESCITINKDFSFRYDGDLYLKSAQEIVHMLIDVVVKGGNLALNVTPQPDGELPAKTLETLNELGNWLKINGEGIYGTRPLSPYATNILGYTQKQDIIYTFIKYNRVYHALRSVELEIKGEVKVIILLRTGKSVPFIQKGNKVVVDTKDFPLYDMKYADCLKILFENPKGE